MISKATEIGTVEIPKYEGHLAMLKFNLQTLSNVPNEFKNIVKKMIEPLKLSGVAWLTIHGKKLYKNQTHRRPGAHTDGNYEPSMSGWSKGGGNGWKVGENGPAVGTKEHYYAYEVETGGIILASNFEACNGWVGEYNGLPGVGGDCSKIELDEPFKLKPNTIYYGNNHFIHESLPMSEDTQRTLVRITLPQNHIYKEDL